MLRLLIDEDFDQRILRLRVPQLDYVIVQDMGLGALEDPVLLDWADRRASYCDSRCQYDDAFGSARLRESLPMPGVIIVPEELDIGRAIDDLEVVIECSTADDLQNQIQYLPL